VAIDVASPDWLQIIGKGCQHRIIQQCHPTVISLLDQCPSIRCQTEGQEICIFVMVSHLAKHPCSGTRRFAVSSAESRLDVDGLQNGMLLAFWLTIEETRSPADPSRSNDRFPSQGQGMTNPQRCQCRPLGVAIIEEASMSFLTSRERLIHLTEPPRRVS
jgi:hypothetical protein